MSPENCVLDVQHLTKKFKGPPSFTAVSDVSFSLQKGEILGLLGPNGAGKTTIIQMLLSTLTPTSGNVCYFGKDLSSFRSEILGHVSFASTYISMPFTLTVEQSLCVFGRLYGLSYRELQANVTSLLERFGILSKLKSPISSLSSGQVTRLALVKAFIVKPKVVLLDEPTASLDPDVSRDIIEFVEEQRNSNDVAVLFTSHNMSEVTTICDRVLFLKEGRIVANDKPKSLAKSVAASKIELVCSKKLEIAVEQAKAMNLFHQVAGSTISIELDNEKIVEYLYRLFKNGISFESIKVLEPTLEDYFIKMSTSG